MNTHTKTLTLLTSLFTLSIMGCSTDISSNTERPTILQINEAENENKDDIKVTKVTKDEEYSKFFTFADDPSQPYIQPRAGGTLIEEEGCLLVKNGGMTSVPIFPDSRTSWDETTKTLTAMGLEIKLGDSFTLSGGVVGDGSYGKLNFVKIAHPKCTINRSYVRFWGR